jgi:hypothetical protein
VGFLLIFVLLRNLHPEEEKDTDYERNDDLNHRVTQKVLPTEVSLDQVQAPGTRIP